MKAITQTELLTQLKKLIKSEAPEALAALLNPLSLMGYPRLVKASNKLLLTNKSRRLRLDLQVALMRCSTLIGKEPLLVKGQRLPQEIPHLLSQLSALLTDLELYMIPDTGTLQGLGWRLWIDICRSLMKELKGEVESQLAQLLAELSNELGNLVAVDVTQAVIHGPNIFARHLGALQRGGDLSTSAFSWRLYPELKHLKERDELCLVTRDQVVIHRWGDCHTLSADPVIMTQAEAQLGMVYIPAGEFWMCADHGLSYPPVSWRHRVKISQPFMMAQIPVTRALYDLVMERQLRVGDGSQDPIDRVSWWDCIALCNRLSEMSGLEPAYQVGHGLEPAVELNLKATGFRLPTEAEYEYAAKAGTELSYSGSDRLYDVVSLGEVAQTSVNAWGLFDMSNYVGAWTNDSWNRFAYRERSQPCVDPLEYTVVSDARVCRGGGVFHNLDAHRVAYRKGVSPNMNPLYTGCRLVRSLRDADAR